MMPVFTAVRTICRWLLPAAILSCPIGSVLVAAEASTDFATLSLEQLGQIKVTTASKRPQSWWTTPAAIQVVTSTDISRTAATTIPEALRYVPGVEVGQLSTHRAVVTIRGFADEFANKLLVLVDGRSVYTPLFSGVYWDAQTINPDEIEQIEVLRGPGGSTWGINAMNGVVNVVTRHAQDTQGTLLSATAGTHDRTYAVRYGGQAQPEVWWRVYARAVREDEGRPVEGTGGDDAWSHVRSGVRFDGGGAGKPQWMGQTEYYRGDADRPILGRPDTIRSEGGHALGRLEVPFAGDATARAVGSVSEARRNSFVGLDHRTDFALDLTAEKPFSKRWLWRAGGGSRLTRQRTVVPVSPVFSPALRKFQVGDLFLEAQHTLVPRQLEATVGYKIEYNDFTQWESLPVARLAYTPDDHLTLWGSYARGARVPSISDHDSSSDFTAGATRTVGRPNPKLPAETLDGFGLGARWSPLADLVFDVTGYWHAYDALRTRQTTITPGPITTVTTRRGDQLRGYVRGAEVAATWEVRRGWRLAANASWIGYRLSLRPGAVDPTALNVVGQSPSHQVGLRSMVDLPRGVRFDLGMRYVDHLPAYRVPSYFDLDLRVAWAVTPNLSGELIGQNLLEASRLEMRSAVFQPAGSEVPRRAALRMTFRR